jgi:hypothetical protein
LFCLFTDTVNPWGIPSTASGSGACLVTNMLDNTPTRTVNYMKQPGEFERCESTFLSKGLIDNQTPNKYKNTNYQNIAQSTTPLLHFDIRTLMGI